MGKKLAIKGHPTRDKEVIELLEMMGGKSTIPIGAILDKSVYTIREGEIFEIPHYNIKFYDFVIFTLEEFLEKYPFKVGDKVVYTKFGDNCDDYPITIESMKWTGTTIEYTFNDCVTCLAKDLKMYKEEPKEVISGIYLNSCDYADEVELNLGDYEIEVRDGRTFAVKKKPKYPKTYEECCTQLRVTDTCKFARMIPRKYAIQMELLAKLLVCRDAYWKIAGEEIGLDKHWEPEYDCNDTKYIISASRNTIYKDISVIFNYILIFPTEEMRDAFYENFKDLIEQCKELL